VAPFLDLTGGQIIADLLDLAISPLFENVGREPPEPAQIGCGHPGNDTDMMGKDVAHTPPRTRGNGQEDICMRVFDRLDQPALDLQVRVTNVDHIRSLLPPSAVRFTRLQRPNRQLQLQKRELEAGSHGHLAGGSGQGSVTASTGVRKVTFVTTHLVPPG
jgi:hypothetical protein